MDVGFVTIAPLVAMSIEITCDEGAIGPFIFYFGKERIEFFDEIVELDRCLAMFSIDQYEKDFFSGY